MIIKPDLKLWTPPRGVVMSRQWRRQRGFFVPMPFHKRYEVDAADFDGTNDYMTRGAGLTGAADSKSGIFSSWVRIDSDTPNVNIFTLTGTPVLVWRGSTLPRRLHVYAGNGATIGYRASTSAIAFDSSWIHILSSWDVATLGAHHLYVNDVSDENDVSFIDNIIDYTGTNAAIGGSEVGGGRWPGCLAEVYFAPGQYLDFSVEANRRKFILASGRPAPLGVNGALPTGTAALVYQRLRNNEAAANFATNRGTGGNFTITGSLDTASSSPSD